MGKEGPEFKASLRYIANFYLAFAMGLQTHAMAPRFSGFWGFKASAFTSGAVSLAQTHALKIQTRNTATSYQPTNKQRKKKNNPSFLKWKIVIHFTPLKYYLEGGASQSFGHIMSQLQAKCYPTWSCSYSNEGKKVARERYTGFLYQTFHILCGQFDPLSSENTQRANCQHPAQKFCPQQNDL